MTIEQAQKLLEEEYERATNLAWVRKPLAYALWRVWKKADKEKNDGTR